jgi:hypothetical protein
MEGIGGKISEKPLKERKRARLLDEIKKVDEDMSIPLTLGKGGSFLSPGFACRVAPMKSSHQSSGGVRPEGGMPGRDNGAVKPSMQCPRSIVLEDGRARDQGEDGGDKGDVV